MFQEYFGIPEDPFSITPDTKYLYLSERHREAYAHLLYGVAEGGSFVQLTGEVGTGKTLLCRKLLVELPQQVNVALIFNPRQSPLELVASLCDELHVHYPLGCTSIKEIVDFLNAYLLESHRAGWRTVLIIDEAQNLSYEALEQVRLLTNLETAKEKLLQIILVGQPELRSLLARPELRQLAQRITARYHLAPLSAAETRAYVLHRLRVAGREQPLFTVAALRRLHRLSGGVPRLINILCSRAMLAAFGAQQPRVTRRLLNGVARELQGVPERARPATLTWAALLLSGLAVASLLYLSAQRLAPDGAWPVVQAAPQGTSAALASASLPAAEPVSPQVARPGGGETGRVRPAEDRREAGQEIPGPAPAPLSVQAGEQAAQPPGWRQMLGSVDNAFATLFAYWQAVYPRAGDDQSACERAQRIGLSCIYGKGGWGNLAYYNRPAVIELLQENGTRSHVVVAGLDDQRVTLDLGGRRVSLPRPEVAALWTGSYIVLWRPPKLHSPYLGVGSQGEDVAWLSAMLDQVEGRPARALGDRPRFDQALKERVVRFQRKHGLMADGVVGKQTLIQLNMAVNRNNLPLLQPSQGPAG